MLTKIICNQYLFRIGKKSTRLVNAAAVKLTEELFNMIERPDYALVTRVREGTESQVSKYVLFISFIQNL